MSNPESTEAAVKAATAKTTGLRIITHPVVDRVDF